MPGQMCWLPRLGGKEKILHLRFKQGDPWRPYTNELFSGLAQADHVAPLNSTLALGDLSKGYATAQYLLIKLGWAYVPTAQAYDSNPELIHKGHNPAAGCEPVNAYARAKAFGLVQ